MESAEVINNKKIKKRIATETTGHVISHTHWDREWRVPEWNSRWRLKKMMSVLLDKLERNPDLKFLFDGQVVSIEDYLDICPEKRPLVEKFIKSGRLQIGPWYNLPDLYPVSGETLIRNLLTGRRHAEKLGKCLNIAYTTFGWGQTAQFPQIFKGFGIERIVCAKNVNKKRAPNSEFIWQSPDGTALFTTRLGVEKRANFFFSALMPIMYGVDYDDDRTRINWGRGGWIWHRSDSLTDSELTFIPEKKYFPKNIKEALKAARETAKDSLIPEHIFLGNGCDSTAPSDVVDKIIEEGNQLFDDFQLKYSGLKEYFDCLESTIEDKQIKLKKVYGELRDGPVHKLSANALATRMPLKILNRKAQDYLLRYAEPFASLAETLGFEYPRVLLDKAWKFLLLAHSHDALNGVTLDKTAEDTENKFKQVIELSQVVSDMSATAIMKNIELSEYEADDILLTVFNPNPQKQNFVVHATVDVPSELSPRRLSVIDTDGTELPSQPIDHYSHQAPVCVENSRALPFYADRHTMYLDTGSIPAYGYKVLKLKPEEKYDKNVKFWYPTYEYGSQISGPCKMSNENLEIQINSDGTYDLTSKTTGKSYKGLGFFEDGGEAGDYWQRVRPNHDRTYNSRTADTEVYMEKDGPLVTSYIIETVLQVPAFADKSKRFKTYRSTEKTEIKIKTELILKAGAEYLEVNTTVDNTARDHRLRVGFPTYIDTETSEAMGHFNVDSRPVFREYEDGIRDGEMSTLPMQNFVDLSNGKSGLAILNKNLTEFEISENKSRTVYLTLLRCMDVKICTENRCATVESEADGPQCLGSYTFNYALYPHSGDWQRGKVYQQTQKYLYAPLIYQMSRHFDGSLCTCKSLMNIDNPLVQLTGLKQSEDGRGLIIRIYNPTEDVIEANINFARKPQKAYKTNMNEEIEEDVEVTNSGNIPVTLDPAKIITLLIEF